MSLIDKNLCKLIFFFFHIWLIWNNFNIWKVWCCYSNHVCFFSQLLYNFPYPFMITRFYFLLTVRCREKTSIYLGHESTGILILCPSYEKCNDLYLLMSYEKWHLLLGNILIKISITSIHVLLLGYLNV